VLPNLVVIGAARCGTTSVHHYLDAHPSIAMSRLKELHFFVAESNWSRGLAWYESQFPDAGAAVRGETSPSYTHWPRTEGVPERIAATLPDVKLVYLVRDPVERTLSAYWNGVRGGHERRSFGEAVTPGSAQRWVVGSRYGTQLERFLAHFPQERILVVDFDDLAHRRAATLRRVFRYLGVDESFTSPEFERRLNVAASTGAPTRVGAAALKALDAVLGETASFRARTYAPRRLVRPLVRPVPRARLDPSARELLAELLAPEAERLRALTGQPFAGWSV
jgi:hypothetical protein